MSQLAVGSVAHKCMQIDLIGAHSDRLLQGQDVSIKIVVVPFRSNKQAALGPTLVGYRVVPEALEACPLARGTSVKRWPLPSRGATGEP